MSDSPIDKSEYEQSLARMNKILKGIASHAEEQAKFRCPYKDAKSQCTAKFVCGYQRPQSATDLPACSHNDAFDYRNAWETAPNDFAELRNSMKAERKQRQLDRESNATAPSATTQVRYEGQTCKAVTGQTLFDHADQLNVPIPTSCGRFGTCHECIVDVVQGQANLNQRTEHESFLRDSYRLACQTVVEASEPQGDVEFKLLRRSPRIVTAPPRTNVSLNPLVTRDAENVYYDGERIDRFRGRMLGLAIDVGTTTCVAELLDFATGESLYVASFENPQRFGGSDVLNRISYDSGQHQGELHRVLINTLNTELRQMCTDLQVDRQTIYEILIVGNATMRDLFFGLDVQSIGTKPYKSDIEQQYIAGQLDTTQLVKTARELKIFANSKARVVGAPLIASHVGADTLAALVAIEMDRQQNTVMLVDIGTNTEVVIGNSQRMLAASCPAGPAFEGGLVEYGMPACDGAIESVRLANGTFEFETIGNDVTPVGLCGSGLIQLLAELRRQDWMTPKTVFKDKAREFTLSAQHGIRFSRQDASHLAQAKAANYCGQFALLREFGVQPHEVTQLYLAGGFANYIDPVAAMEIGFLAPVPQDRIVKVGNAASQGASEMLLCGGKRKAIKALIPRIEHVELETIPDFFDLFVEGCQFKPMVF